MRRALDEVILQRAREEGRVLVCYDKDFPAWLAISSATSPSVISVRRQGLEAPEFCIAIDEVLSTHREALELGAIVVIGRHRNRCRRLPIR